MAARRRDDKTRQTMDELLTAALELFGSKGFVATTVAEITERAGYAKGTFYRFWPSKDEILLQLIEQKLASYRGERQQRLAAAGDLERVLEVIWDFLDAILEDQAWARVFLEFTVHATRHPQLAGELHKGKYRLSDEIFADLVRPHVHSDFPLEKLAALNTALFEGFLVHRALGLSTLSREDARSAAITLALTLAASGPSGRACQDTDISTATPSNPQPPE